MINKKQAAIIKKDIRGIAANSRMLGVLLVVPLVMAVFIPVIFILAIQFSPQEDIAKIAQLVRDFSAASADSGIAGAVSAGGIAGGASPNAGILPAEMHLAAIKMILNYVMPLFFLLIPIMASSVMAAGAFVGEKEKSTLETLLYSPLRLKDIFSAKILASFLLSMAVSVSSFIAMLLALETTVFLTSGIFILPGINWLITMLLVSPSAALLAINLIVRGSAKSQSIEESQQRAVFLILPVILFITGQFTGIMMLSAWLLLAMGAVLAAAALLMFRGSFAKFRYETLI